METLIAILCPGPSLVYLTSEQMGKPDEIIAINTAMSHPLAAMADWWCAHDLWTSPLPKYVPRMGMVTCRAAIDQGQADLVRMPLFDFRRARISDSVRISTSAAIYWAADRIAERGGNGHIQLHGCDMAGTSHWDGVDDPGWTNEQWALARADLRRAIDAIPYRVLGAPC